MLWQICGEHVIPIDVVQYIGNNLDGNSIAGLCNLFVGSFGPNMVFWGESGHGKVCITVSPGPLLVNLGPGTTPG